MMTDSGGIARAGFSNAMVGKVLAALFVAAIVVYPIWRGFGAIGQTMDEGLLLVYPEQILKGRLPYRDFETVLGPGNFGLLAAAYSAFSINIYVERAVGFALRMLILVSIFGIAQRWKNVLAVASTMIAGLLLACVDVTAFAWSSALAFSLASLWLMADMESRWRNVAAGLVGGLSMLCRFDFTPAIVAAAVPIFLKMETPARKRYVAGLAAAFLPLVWLVLVIGPGPIIHNTVLFPLFHLTQARHLPISTAPEYLRRLLWMHFVASALNIGAGAEAIRSAPNEQRNYLLLGAALLGLGCTHYGLQRFDIGHLIVPLVVSFGLLPLTIFNLCRRITTLPTRILPWISVAVILVVAQLLTPELTRFLYGNVREEFTLLLMPREPAVSEKAGRRAIFIEHKGRSFCFVTPEDAQAARAMLDELDRVTLPGQRLFVGPGDLRRTNYCDTYIYHMLPQLVPATYHLEMNPLSANGPDSHLAQEVQSADWLVLNRFWDSWNEPNASSYIGSDEPNAVVQNNFDLWAESGSYLIFRSKKLRNAVMTPPS